MPYRMHRAMTRIASHVLVLSVAVAAHARAQADPSDVKHRNDCRLAAQVVATGRPAPKTEWANQFIVSCIEDGPTALVAGLHRFSTSDDRVQWLAFNRSASYVADAGFFAAALDVASDPTASLTARIVSFVIALKQLQDRTEYNLGDLLSASPSYLCFPGIADHSLRYLAFTRLPSTAPNQLRAVAAAVASAPGTPSGVVNAARCATWVMKYYQ